MEFILENWFVIISLICMFLCFVLTIRDRKEYTRSRFKLCLVLIILAIIFEFIALINSYGYYNF